MRNERKAAKRRAQHRDYEKKRNRNKYVSKVVVELHRAIYKSTTEKSGRVILEQVGERKVFKKYEPEGYNRQLTPGDGILPKSRKFTESTTRK